jgi:hypothetical protein
MPALAMQPWSTQSDCHVDVIQKTVLAVRQIDVIFENILQRVKLTWV